MSDLCEPNTERDFTSYHMMMTVDWLELALAHAKKNDGRASLMLVTKNSTGEYKICDGLGGLEALVSPGDWWKIIREEYANKTEPRDA